MAKKQGKKDSEGGKGLLADYVSDGVNKGENLGFKALLGAQIKDKEKTTDRSDAIREVIKSEEAESGLTSEIRQVMSAQHQSLDGLQVLFLGEGDRLDFRPAGSWKAAWEASSMVYEATADQNASLHVHKADGGETIFAAGSGMSVRVCGSTAYVESVPAE